MSRESFLLALALFPACFVATVSAATVVGLKAVGGDSRIDLSWHSSGSSRVAGYNVYRADRAQGPFTRLNKQRHVPPLYSDFLGANGLRRWYRVSGVSHDESESAWSTAVSAVSTPETRKELLTSVQRATFRYFWDFGHPVSGMARERNTSGDLCATGGTGFGVLALVVGAERGFVPREAVVERLLTLTRFLAGRASRYHGAWAHWINGRTGATIPFASKNGVQADDGGDLVETSFLMEGLLTARQYFDHDEPHERELRRRITALWQGVEWNWYLRRPGGKVLYWHWSPRYQWRMDFPITGQFNECLLTYLLAVASPTHPIPGSCYYEGWVGTPQTYVNGHTYYGYKQWVGPPLGGPLFFTHYSFLGFDPRGKRDRFCNYFEQNRNVTLINRAYCLANPKHFTGYSDLVWGLTASDEPDGYAVHCPGPDRRDNGTIAPTAALSAMPYTPAESLATLNHFYHVYGRRLWGEFGFHDAFNLTRNWFARSYLAIDQGPIVVMLENYRSQLCWRMFMRNPEILPALKAAGWTID